MNFYLSAKHPDNQGNSVADNIITNNKDETLSYPTLQYLTNLNVQELDLSVSHILATPGDAANPPGKKSTGSAIWLIQVALVPVGQQMMASVVSAFL